jgi:hypothetical protein
VVQVRFGTAIAPLNIWRQGAVEVLMLPVIYSVLSTTEVRVLAFSTTGEFLGDALVTRFQEDVTGGPVKPEWFPPVEWKPGVVPPSVPPFPGVAIFTGPQGGLPLVLVSDGNQTLVGYTFALENNTGRFTEKFRFRDTKRVFFAPPMILADGYTRLATLDGTLLSAGPNTSATPAPLALGAGRIFAAPTRTADGRLIVVSYPRDVPDGTMVVLGSRSGVSRIKLPGSSLGSAAASRTHVFVAATRALVTYDVNTMAEVGRFSWFGGLWPPAIGPQGHVYAMAKNVLFVFRPPIERKPPPVPPTELRREGPVREHR